MTNAIHILRFLLALFGLCLSACVSTPRNGNDGHATPMQVNVKQDLLSKGFGDNKPVFTCYVLGGTKPAGCKDPEVAPGEYFNDRTIQNRYQHEWLDPTSKPFTGLALSGGGTKAAGYALGIFAGLTPQTAATSQPQMQAKVNDFKGRKMDVVSSVSGGSYAALWYFSRLLDDYSEYEQPGARRAQFGNRWGAIQ
jgi:hypothetical protein